MNYMASHWNWKAPDWITHINNQNKLQYFFIVSTHTDHFVLLLWICCGTWFGCLWVLHAAAGGSVECLWHNSGWCLMPDMFLHFFLKRAHIPFISARTEFRGNGEHLIFPSCHMSAWLTHLCGQWKWVMRGFQLNWFLCVCSVLSWCFVWVCSRREHRAQPMRGQALTSD